MLRDDKSGPLRNLSDPSRHSSRVKKFVRSIYYHGPAVVGRRRNHAAACCTDGAREPMIQFDPLEEIDDARRGRRFVVPCEDFSRARGAKGAQEVTVGGGASNSTACFAGLDTSRAREARSCSMNSPTTPDCANPRMGRPRQRPRARRVDKGLARGEGKRSKPAKTFARISRCRRNGRKFSSPRRRNRCQSMPNSGTEASRTPHE